MTKESKDLQKKSSIDNTYQSVKEILEKARNTAYKAVNFAMVQAYWQIGKVIVDEEEISQKVECSLRRRCVYFEI